jgi:hypothetical protein
MLDRVFKFIIVVTLVLFLLQYVVSSLWRVLESVLAAFGLGLAQLGSLITGLLSLVALVVFSLGVVDRARQFVLSRDPRVARERAASARAVRTRVRRPAEDAPVHEPPAVPEDPDPAVNEPEEE